MHQTKSRIQPPGLCIQVGPAGPQTLLAHSTGGARDESHPPADQREGSAEARSLAQTSETRLPVCLDAMSPADVPVRRFNSIRSAMRHLDADCDGNVDRSEATALLIWFSGSPAEAKKARHKGPACSVLFKALAQAGSGPWIRNC